MVFPFYLQQFSIDEFVIELFVPDAAAVRTVYQDGATPFPYWSQVWPAAKAMATFLVRHPSFANEKKVVELGAGLGLPSLVAAQHAAQVLCTDYVPEAVKMAAISVTHAGLKNVTAAVLDWQHLPPNLEVDVLLLSDVNYEPEAFAVLTGVINTFLSKGTTILLSTPQRLMAKGFIAPLLANCVKQEEVTVWHEGKEVLITVLVLEKIP
jgi:predicted nicotinamide N-methyase